MGVNASTLMIDLVDNMQQRVVIMSEIRNNDDGDLDSILIDDTLDCEYWINMNRCFLR